MNMSEHPSDKKFIFSICTRCENDSQTKLPIDCVKHIKFFYPHADIAVVDSDSPVQSHISKLKEMGCFISDIKNNNYEAGAIWDTYSKYDRDAYVFLQDSMLLLGTIDKYLYNDITVIGDMSHNWSYCNEHHINWARENITKSNYTFMEEGFRLVQYNSMIISKKLMSKFKSKNLDKVLPNSKIGSCSMERIFGIALTLEGYEINEKIHLPKYLIQKLSVQRQ